VKDAEAARGFALAYAALEPLHRMQIIDAVLVDAVEEGIGPSAVLASLLPVENDLNIARRIAEAMSMAGDRGLRAAERARALIAGSESDGAAILIRPLHGAFVEALGLVWTERAGVVHTVFEPLAHHEKASKFMNLLPASLRFEEIPVPFAIDVVTLALWNHRRLHRALPECVEHFADMFTISDRKPDCNPGASHSQLRA